jgi:hypothetical protein
MTPRETIIDQLMTIKFGNPNIFFSPTAKTIDGALLQSSKYFYEFLQKGYIHEIKSDLITNDRRKYVLYYPTYKGACFVGRQDEYKHKDHKASSIYKHDCMGYDIALRLILAYPDWKFTFEYNKEFDHRVFDVYITATKNDKTLYFILELERKVECYKEVNKKIEIFNKVKSKLPFGTKLIFTLSYLYHDPLLRPQEYGRNKETEENIRINNKQFERFIKNAPKGYLYLNFVDFCLLKFYDAGGTPRKLINN